MALTALALNCTLKSSKEKSSTDKLLKELLAALGRHKVEGEIVRVADLNIKPGVTSDEGPGDAWPALRKRVLAADILIIGTPIWLGQPSSVAKRVLERMDAFLEETDKKKRMPSFGKVGIAAVVGNEDGAHHCHAEVYQALNDVGFTIPACAGTYWVGLAMAGTDYKDLRKPHRETVQATKLLAANAAHLAACLKAKAYPWCLMLESYAPYVGGTAAFFASLCYIPQVKKAWPRGSTQDLSLSMLGVLTLGLTLWLI